DPDTAAEQREQGQDEQRRDERVIHGAGLPPSARTLRTPRHSSVSSSTNAIASTIVPNAIASCGIQSGVASLPVEMSLNCHDWNVRRTLYHANATASTVAAASAHSSSPRRTRGDTCSST